MVKKKLQTTIIIIVAVAIHLATICLVIQHKEQQAYESAFDSILPTAVLYKGVHTEQALNADYRGLFTFLGEKRLYFGPMPDDTVSIVIYISFKTTITVYPRDDESVYFTYAPHHGVSRNYILDGQHGGFNRHLEILYQITGNEVFNETIDLPKAE